MSVIIWHDVECGGYAEDLFLWRSLAAEHGDPVLDVGAGTGDTVIRLASAVGADGRAIGVEPNPAMREVAAGRADTAGVPRA